MGLSYRLQLLLGPVHLLHDVWDHLWATVGISASSGSSRAARASLPCYLEHLFPPSLPYHLPVSPCCQQDCFSLFSSLTVFLKYVIIEMPPPGLVGMQGSPSHSSQRPSLKFPADKTLPTTLKRVINVFPECFLLFRVCFYCCFPF